MALDYRYVVGRKKMRDSQKPRFADSIPKKKLYTVRVKATGAEGLVECMSEFNSIPELSPVVVSFGCHGQKKYIRSALEIVNV